MVVAEICTILLPLRRYSPWGTKWTAFCGWERWNSTCIRHELNQVHPNWRALIYKFVTHYNTHLTETGNVLTKCVAMPYGVSTHCHLTSPIVFMPFWSGNFLIVGLEEEDPFHGSLILQIWLLLIFFLLGFVKRHCLPWKNVKCEWTAWQNHKRCRYWAYKKLCKVQCLKMYRFLQYTLWLKIYIIFYFIAI